MKLPATPYGAVAVTHTRAPLSAPSQHYVPRSPRYAASDPDANRKPLRDGWERTTTVAWRCGDTSARPRALVIRDPETRAGALQPDTPLTEQSDDAALDALWHDLAYGEAEQ